MKPIEVPCESCGSQAGDPCRTSYAAGNRPTKPHGPRRWLAQCEEVRLAGQARREAQP